MKLKRSLSAWLLLSFLTAPVILATSCKKHSNNDDISPTGDVRDSVYMVAKEVYLWVDNLPEANVFNPKSLAGPDEVIEKIKTYSPLVNNMHLDRYSFGLPEEEYNNLANGIEVDFGCGFKFLRSSSSESSDDLRISYVYRNSPASIQGVQRGWRILSIKGIAGNTSNVNALNAALNTVGSVPFQFQTPSGEIKNINITPASYTANTVVKNSVIDLGTKKVGYVMFNTFFGTANAELDAVFADFAARNVTDVVVDLRYNGGGRVDIAEHFANLLAPAGAKGNLMFTDQHNSILSAEGYNESVNFDNNAVKLPALQKIAFIGTAGTASASELLINVLKPYLGENQKLFGATTYGKPVGFYPITINRRKSDAYTTLIVAVKSTNSQGLSDYYQGFTPDAFVQDDVTKDFGDTQEASLKAALNWIQTGTIATTSVATESVIRSSPKIDAANAKFDRSFKGSIFEEKK